MSFGLLADLASVVGLLITIVGFAVTIRNVRKARQAAEEARQAARDAVTRIAKRLLDEEMSINIQFLLEIEAACHDEDWGVAILRGNDLRVRLAKVSNHFWLLETESDDLSLSLAFLGKLMFSLARLQKGTIKRLPLQHLDSLSNLTTKLAQVRGRILSGEFEV
jgi:multidrug efflux pump subunit AcrA (membrane-fusion protein)